MFFFERDVNPDLKNFDNALWYTSIAITVGSDYGPYSPEGRVLAFMLGLFSFALDGYVTATLASYFIGMDAEGG
jgi:voltage-gated potassium channel